MRYQAALRPVTLAPAGLCHAVAAPAAQAGADAPRYTNPERAARPLSRGGQGTNAVARRAVLTGGASATTRCAAESFPDNLPKFEEVTGSHET